MDESRTSAQPEMRQRQEALALVENLFTDIQAQSGWNPEKKQEATQCLEGIREKIRQNLSPSKEQFDDFLKAIGEHEEETTTFLRLGELYGYLPSL